MGIRLDWHSKRSGQAKISNFDSVAIIANENILGFHISMEYTVVVHENERLKKLICEALNLL
jgi:hypothetical protein